LIAFFKSMADNAGLRDRWAKAKEREGLEAIKKRLVGRSITNMNCEWEQAKL